ncbi:MAG: beta-ketoacyl-[acyl-carrier-protein] synthase family protein [Candidatus Binatia bacterium]
MKDKRAVITGFGLATPLGRGVNESWANLKDLRTGIRHVPRPGAPGCFQYLGRIENLVLPDPIPVNLSAQMKFLNRGALLGFAAAFEAVSQAGVKLESIHPGRRALFIASGDFTKVGYESFYPAFEQSTGADGKKVDRERLNRATLTEVNPFLLLESISNNLFSFLSAFYELRGPNTSVASLSPYGSQALELACRAIEQERAGIAVVVGYCNWITDIPLYELEGLGLLSKCQSGAASFRPFDRTRDGFIPGEGGAAVFLEAEDAAKRRGAKALARICGSGNCIDFVPGSALAVAPKVTEKSLRLALEEAGCEMEDLAFICGHGSATQKGDRSELMSMLDLAQREKASVPVCGLKSYSGHMGAASDLAEIIWAIKAVEEGFVPATLNFRSAEKEFDVLGLSGCHRPTSKGFLVSSSYGIGGQSSAIVVSVSRG